MSYLEDLRCVFPESRAAESVRLASGKSRLARRKYFIELDDKRKQFMRFRERQPGIRSRYESIKVECLFQPELSREA